MDFDFGPISRTETGGRKDSFNLTSLPLHEIMDALMAAVDRDEFVAWLWHDVFKPLFWFRKNKKGQLNWIHIANDKIADPLAREVEWSAKTCIPLGLVSSHHYRNKQKLTYKEKEIISDQFDQVGLGREARFLQLAFVAEPATNTSLLRAVVADAFMETVTKAAAEAIRQQLHTKQPVFERVRYVFEFGHTQLSSRPTDAEIQVLANRYDVQVQGDELVITHFTPVRSPDFDGRRVEMVVDLTATPPTPERFKAGVFSLVELLTAYQDSRTILMSIPQFLQVGVGQLTQQVKNVAERRLRSLDIRTLATEADLKKQARVRGRLNWATLPLIRQGQAVDLLAHVFVEQVRIRLIEKGQLTQKVRVRDKKGNLKERQVRWLNEIVSWPVELLKSKSRRCRFCNTAFDGFFPLAEATVGIYFTDIEHVGFGGDICPMCRIYRLNSHKSRTPTEKAQGITGDRKVYRGAFALIAPSSHFTYVEDQCKLVEQPPLDVGGRFANPLQRATVTLQEYGLFNMLSRRIISQIWSQLDDANDICPLPLPYLGAILLTQNEGFQIRTTLFDCLEMLFDQVELLAYPFRVTVQPAVELAFEMAVNDLQKHHTKHTYLKTNPIIVAADPRSKFTLLVDNGIQLEVSKEFFEDQRRLCELREGIGKRERQHNWLLAVLQGNDPVTATAEAFYDRSPFGQAERMFWDTQLSAASPAEQWQQYEEVRDEMRRIVAKYPMLIWFFAKPRRR